MEKRRQHNADQHTPISHSNDSNYSNYSNNANNANEQASKPFQKLSLQPSPKDCLQELLQSFRCKEKSQAKGIESSLQNAMDALNEDADAYMLKPFDMDALLKTVERQLREQAEEKEYNQDKVTEFIRTRVKQLGIAKET